MTTVAVSGASGLVGRALTAALASRQWKVIRLVRRPPRSGEVRWDPGTEQVDAGGLAGCDAVVHLAGENIGHRWTPARKRRIRDSRVAGTRILARALAGLDRPPAVLISASAVGIYGDRGDEELTETSPTGSGFLPDVGRAWEAAADAAREAGIRVVHPRFGIILTPEGGALSRMLLPFRLGVGGPLGSGQQWMSWITLRDVIEVLLWAVTTPTVEGPVNAVAPTPVTNADFARALGAALRRPAILPVPAFALELLFGQMARETLLASQRALPARLTAAGFPFRDPGLSAALRALLA